MDEVVQISYRVPDFLAVTLGMVTYFLGAFLTRKVAFLRNYNIPEPVSGGLAIAVLTWLAFAFFNLEITFDLATRDLLLVIFFTTIGLNARIADLISGGRLLFILLVMTVILICLQNIVGLIGVSLFSIPQSVGVLFGSASLIGGHGTAIAWGPVIETQSGFEAAAELGVATATFGLVFAALIGGPIAKYLIDRNRLKPSEKDGSVVGLPYQEADSGDQTVSHVNLMRSLLAINCAIIIGYFANQITLELGLKLPLFVSCLLVAIIMSNTIPVIFTNLPWPSRTRALAVISDYSLSIFLAMSLMSMQLWTLAELGGPLLGIVLLQVLIAASFILFIFFRIVGSDFTAAVLCAGFAGFSLGATPTAVANMTSVTKRYGPAPLAFLTLPLVSAFFVDLANALIIQFFVNL